MTGTFGETLAIIIISIVFIMGIANIFTYIDKFVDWLANKYGEHLFKPKAECRCEHCEFYIQEREFSGSCKILKTDVKEWWFCNHALKR